MNNLVKSTAIGTLLTGALSANAFAAESTVPTIVPTNTPITLTQSQELSIVDSFYQGDFQQLGRAVEKSQDPAIMYRGINAIRVPTIMEFSAI